MTVRTRHPAAILVVAPWKRRWELAPRGGIADDYYFIDAFTRAGYAVHCLCPRDDAPADVTIEGYNLHTFPDFFRRTRRWPLPLRRVLWLVFFSTLALARGIALVRRVRPRVVVD